MPASARAASVVALGQAGRLAHRYTGRCVPCQCRLAGVARWCAGPYSRCVDVCTLQRWVGCDVGTCVAVAEIVDAVGGWASTQLRRAALGAVAVLGLHPRCALLCAYHRWAGSSPIEQNLVGTKPRFRLSFPLYEGLVARGQFQPLAPRSLRLSDDASRNGVSTFDDVFRRSGRRCLCRLRQQPTRARIGASASGVLVQIWRIMASVLASSMRACVRRARRCSASGGPMRVAALPRVASAAVAGTTRTSTRLQLRSVTTTASASIRHVTDACAGASTEPDTYGAPGGTGQLDPCQQP